MGHSKVHGRGHPAPRARPVSGEPVPRKKGKPTAGKPTLATGAPTGYQEGQKRPAAYFIQPIGLKGPKATRFAPNPPTDMKGKAALRDPRDIESVLKRIKIKYLGNDVMMPVSGSVQAQFTIGKDGKVRDIVLSAGHFLGDIGGTNKEYVIKSLHWAIEHLRFDPAGSEDHITTSFSYSQ